MSSFRHLLPMTKLLRVDEQQAAELQFLAIWRTTELAETILPKPEKSGVAWPRLLPPTLA